MTPEEVNRTIEFLLDHAAQFTIHMEQLRLRQEAFAKQQEEFSKLQKEITQRHERDYEVLRHEVAQFESWAAEVIAMHSKRLDQHEKRLDG